MKKIIIALFVVLEIILITSCSSSRSAAGLDAGNVQVALISPTHLSFRGGITDNIEGRIIVVGARKLSTDLFFHTHYDSSKFNFGLALGTRFDHRIFGKKSEEKLEYFTSFTISKEFGKYTPYFTYTYDTYREFRNYLTLGTEISLYVNDDKDFALTLVPELNYFFKPMDPCFFIPCDETLHFAGTLSLGISFSLF